MDVEVPAEMTQNQAAAKDAHETRERDKIGRMLLDRLDERSVERLARGELALIDDRGGNARLRGELEAGGVGAVADHRGDLRREPRAHDRLHVAAAAGDQDHDRFHLRYSSAAPLLLPSAVGLLAPTLLFSLNGAFLNRGDLEV